MNFNRVFHYKASILGAHPYFWKHPYGVPYPHFICFCKYWEIPHHIHTAWRHVGSINKSQKKDPSANNFHTFPGNIVSSRPKLQFLRFSPKYNQFSRNHVVREEKLLRVIAALASNAARTWRTWMKRPYNSVTNWTTYTQFCSFFLNTSFSEVNEIILKQGFGMFNSHVSLQRLVVEIVQTVWLFWPQNCGKWSSQKGKHPQSSRPDFPFQADTGTNNAKDRFIS